MITTPRLSSQDRLASPQDEQADSDRQTASLAAMAVVLLLVIVGLQLVHVLRDRAAIEDCLMVGRHDCDALLHPPPVPP